MWPSWGTRAFVAELGGLRVIDVANPAAPLAAGFLVVPGGYGQIVTAADKVIAATGDAVDLIDVSKPEAPVRVASVPISAPGPIELAWEGGFALARDGLGVVHILEVTSAQGLREVSTYNPPGGIWGGEMFGNEVFAMLGRARAMGLPTIAIAGGYLYVADLDGGLRVVSIAQSGRPTEVGARMADLNPSNVARFGDRLLAFSEEEGGAAWSWQLSEFDLSSHPELAEPTGLGTLELAGETDLASVCGYLSGFLSLTRSGDAEQSPSGDYALGDVAGALTGVANQGDTLYLLDPDRGLGHSGGRTLEIGILGAGIKPERAGVGSAPAFFVWRACVLSLFRTAGGRRWSSRRISRHGALRMTSGSSTSHQIR